MHYHCTKVLIHFAKCEVRSNVIAHPVQYLYYYVFITIICYFINLSLPVQYLYYYIFITFIYYYINLSLLLYRNIKFPKFEHGQTEDFFVYFGVVIF